MAEVNKFEQHAIVEVMGHSVYGGLVSEYTIGGASFIRVDVPECDGRPAFSKLLSPGSIFSNTPCCKEAAVEFVKQHRPRPLASVDLVPARVPALPGFREEEDEDRDY